MSNKGQSVSRVITRNAGRHTHSSRRRVSVTDHANL